MSNFRDLTLVDMTPSKQLVIACDSSAGIGKKPLDEVDSPTGLVARFALRVPLLELFCFGAKPICIVDTLGNEMEPTGKTMIASLQAEMQAAGIGQIPLNGSTEDNMTTKTTSVGVTVIGEKRSSVGQVNVDSATIYQFGSPHVGSEVLAYLDTMITYQDVQQIRAHAGVLDMLPVGSQGILHEVSELARTNHLEMPNKHLLSSDEYVKSAGPATVVLALVAKTYTQQFEVDFPTAEKITTLAKPKVDRS